MAFNRAYFTDEEWAEIQALLVCEAVKVAKKEQREKMKEKQKLYQLRWYKKRGEQLLKEKRREVEYEKE